MKPIKVQVEIKENWAKQRYALFYTKDFNLVELDYPSGDRKEARVYHMSELGKKYVTFSSLPQGIIGAETASRIILYEKGYYVTKFEYPQELAELRKQAFKENK